MFVRVVKDGVEDRESTIYRTLLEDVKKYLSGKFMNKSKFLPIPSYVQIVEDNQSNGLHSIFVMENMRHLSFKEILSRIVRG